MSMNETNLIVGNSRKILPDDYFPPLCLPSIGLSIKNSPLALNESVEFMIGTVHSVMTAAKCVVLMGTILANKR